MVWVGLECAWAGCGCLRFAVGFGVINAGEVCVFDDVLVIWVVRCVCLVWFLL